MSQRGTAYGLIVAGILATMALVSAAGLTVAPAMVNLGSAVPVAASALCLWLCRRARIAHGERVTCAIECILLLAAASLAGAVASYPLAALSSGWWDADLLRADAALGLDWTAYWQFVQGHPLLNRVLGHAYSSIMITPFILVLILAATGRREHAYGLVVAYCIALAVTDFTLMHIPARSAAANLLLPGDPTMPQPGVLHIPVIEQLRSGALTEIGLPLNGLIAIPSFHAAAATLFIWAAWPLRMLRVPCTVVNVLMLLSTPIQGGHYFIDTFAGMGVAVIALAVAQVLSKASWPNREGAGLQGLWPALARKLRPSALRA